MRRHQLLCIMLGIIFTACGQPSRSATSPVELTPSPEAGTSSATLQPLALPLEIAPATVTPIVITTNHGQTLSVEPRPDGDDYPPPAWLVVGDQVIQGTAISYGAADGVAPEYDNLATATVPAGAVPVLIIGAGPLEELHVAIRPWDGKDTAVSTTPDPLHPTIFTLEPINASGRHVVSARIQLARGVGGDVLYAWPLDMQNP